MKKKIIYTYLTLSIISNLFPQRLVTESNKFDRLKNEFNSIYNNKITEETFFYPFVEKKPSNRPLSIGYKHFFVIEPVAAVRISNSDMEMYVETFSLNDSNSMNPEVNESMLWISPGIKIHSTIPIMTGFTNIWMYNWATFFKHSAYGFDGLQSWVDRDIPLFDHSSEYAIEYYEPTQSPNSGLDFDEGQSGIAVLSEKFQFIFGKFQTNIGPFYSGNLSISDNPPSFNQFLLKANFNNKIHFSYLVGSLTSYIEKKYEPLMYNDSWCHTDYYDNCNNDGFDPNQFTDEEIYKLFDSYISDISAPMLNRYVVNHRFDFLPTEQFRIGLYEQIIFGGNSIPFGYLIPLNPLLSSQHSTNDLDNLQIGLDLEYINKKNRITFALMMDEWALYDTFKRTERNWFAYQFGFSRIGELFNKNMLFKLEYTYVDPGAYNHRFLINQPKHHGYNLGYWSDTDSDDFLANISFFLNEKSILLFEYQYTRFNPYSSGIARFDNIYRQYENDSGVDHLEEYISKNKFCIVYTQLVRNDFHIDLEYSRLNNINKMCVNTSNDICAYDNNIIDSPAFNTSELFSSKKTHDIRIKLRYNISK